MRIVGIRKLNQVRQIMQGLEVDSYGINIMLPKSVTYLVRINNVSIIAANILKQEMLSLGADAALPRGVLTGKLKKTDCLLIANLSQYSRLITKLKLQPFGLAAFSNDLSVLLENYQTSLFSLDLGKTKLDLGRRSKVMGIINVTADSFSADGLINQPVEAVVEYAQRLVADGADIIDIGGESTRPGARPVSLKEELRRVIPVVKAISKKLKVPVSVDTSKFEVAKQALDNGAVIINDVTGLRDAKMAKVVSAHKAAVVIMHMKGTPQNMQRNPEYGCLLEEIIGYFKQAIDRAREYGIKKDKILIDPGIGFGKLLEHNLEIINHLEEFKILGMPILVGPSRKSFIGKLLKVEAGDRLSGTIAASVLAVRHGASIVRGHDVLELKRALVVADAILN